MLTGRGQAAAQAAVGDGLADRGRLGGGPGRAHPAGRLLADAVIRGLTG